MKNNYLKKAVLATMLTLAGSFYHTNLSKDYNPEIKFKQSLERIIEREKTFHQRIQEQSSDEIKAPKYKTKGSKCSRYVRQSARDLFGKTYFWRDAWDLRYPSEIVHTFSEKQGEKLERELKELIIDGVLTQGAVIGIKQPDDQTAYENEIDQEGNIAKYTHVIVYGGLDPNGKPVFFHEYGFDQEKISLDYFKENNFTPIEVIIPKNDPVYLAQVKESQEKTNKI